MSLSIEQILALAPDAASATAGRGLAKPAQWSSLGSDASAVWGLCQGSGASPYQVRVALDGPAFKCSCPSRKFPCKHGLALLLLRAGGSVPDAAEAPVWVSEWLASRGERAQRAAERPARSEPDPARERQAAARAEQREERVREGIAMCLRWCGDLVRGGLVAARSGSGADRMAARLVDAQAPGLARAVERVGEALAGGGESAADAWLDASERALGRLVLLLESGSRLESLPEDLAADVRVALGWTQTREQATGVAPVEDRWIVVGRVAEELDRGTQERTWLLGERSARRALLLEFHPGGRRSAGVPLLVGGAFDAALHFYPSRLPLRALVPGDAAGSLTPGSLTPGSLGAAAVDETFATALDRVADELALLPWLERHLLLVRGCRLVRDGDRWHVVDGAGQALPLERHATPMLLLALLLLSEDAGLTLALEYDGLTARPLSAWSETRAGASFDCVQLGGELDAIAEGIVR